MEDGAGIPIIDLSLAEDIVSQAIRAACIDFGFFIVQNHGVREETIADAFAVNKAFFDLPATEKKKIAADKNFRGYTAMHDEKLSAEAARGDTKEGLYFGREMPADDPTPLTGPNQWPSEDLVPGYRKAIEAYVEAVSQLGFHLVQLLALALHLPKGYFDTFFQQPMTYLRPLHYSNEKSSEEARIFGAGAHTDYGMLTILKTSEEGGLQVYVNGRWTDVCPPSDGFIINLGDMLERWTNRLFKSTLHRVMGTGKERYSLPFFYEPAFYTLVECLPSCSSAENPPRFPATTSGQYVVDKYAKTHASYANSQV